MELKCFLCESFHKSPQHLFRHLNTCGTNATINIDFDMKFPTAKNLEERWAQYGANICHLLKSKISNSQISKKLQSMENIDKESQTFMLFWYLHNLFPPQQKISSKPSGSKIRKKCSIADSQDGFAVLAATSGEMDAKLKLLRLQRRNIQPRLLVVGELHI